MFMDEMTARSNLFATTRIPGSLALVGVEAKIE